MKYSVIVKGKTIGVYKTSDEAYKHFRQLKAMGIECKVEAEFSA